MSKVISQNGSLYVSIPKAMARAMEVKKGDHLLPNLELDKSKNIVPVLKFIKL
jgi:antitoxin component of MazEF toxin-antitoxin module